MKMTLKEFLYQKNMEYYKYLRNPEFMKSMEHQDTMLEDKLFESRGMDFKGNTPNLIKQFHFDEEYRRMISLLKFVFPNLPEDRDTFRCPSFLTADEIQKYEQKETLKKEKIICKMDEDLTKCKRLLCYLLLMKITAHHSKIHRTEGEIKSLFHSFAKNLPDYHRIVENEEQTNDKGNHKKRKSNENKSESLNRLYERIFIKTSDNAFDCERNLSSTLSVEEEEKSIIYFLLHVDSAQDDIMMSTKKRIIDQLMKRDSTATDWLSKTEKASNNFDQIVIEILGIELLENFECVERNYEYGKNYIYYTVNPLGKESVFDELNSAEINFINYLYQLYYSNCEKYGDTDKAAEYDISNPRNSRKWNILNKKERETLAEYIWKLCDDSRTVLKYVRETDLYEEKKYSSFFKHFSRGSKFAEEDLNAEEEDFSEKSSDYLGEWRRRDADDLNDILENAKKIIYSLVASISTHPYYNSFKCAERVFQLFQDAPYLIDLEDPDEKKLYLDLEAKIKNAYTIYVKLAKCLEKKQKIWEKDDK